MKMKISRLGVAVVLLAGTLALAACSGPSASMSPTGPTAAASAAVPGATFGTNPDPCEPPNVVDPDTGECVPPPPPPPPGDQGCTPGYWKANVKKGAGEWTLAGYSPTQTVGSVFAASSFNTDSLLDALQYGGGAGVSGASQILLRAAVAAVLNAASPGVAYPLSVAEIVAAVNDALDGGDRDDILALASRLDGYNNLGCPLNNN